MNEYSINDFRSYSLAHSWGNKPDQKAREREYNKRYYQLHKHELYSRKKMLGDGGGNAKKGNIVFDYQKIRGRTMPMYNLTRESDNFYKFDPEDLTSVKVDDAILRNPTGMDYLNGILELTAQTLVNTVKEGPSNVDDNLKWYRHKFLNDYIRRYQKREL